MPEQGQAGAPASAALSKRAALESKPDRIVDVPPPLARALKPENIEPVKPAEQAKPAEAATGVRVALKSVEGYAVQLSFPQKIDAQRWSETLSREGYTTSITSVGEASSVRLRVGSFSSPEAAKTLLGRLQKQGLTGFVIQVPKG
jgi:cell division septation protein DedD